MGKEKFEEYLKSQKKNEEEISIDWKERKEQWIKSIDEYFTQVESYFTKYEDSVIIEEKKYSINEEYLGSYETKKLIVKFNNDTVTFTPVGRNVIGAKGRIDMEGKAGVVKFVLVGENTQTPHISTSIITNVQEQQEFDDKMKKLDKMARQEKSVWKISTPPPKIKYIEFNEDSFFDALMEIING